jgi:hypothetical protein
MNTKQYDYSAFSRRYTLNQLWQHFKTYGKYGVLKIAGFGIIVAVFAFMTGVFASVISSILQSTAATVTVWAVFGLGSVLAMYLLVRATVNSMKKSMQLKDFAATNQLTFHENKAPLDHPGVLFQYGDSRMFTRQLIVPDSTQAVVGNYQYATGSGKSRRVHTYGVLRVTLSRKLPHVVLDARSNNFLGHISNISYLDSSQQIQLEGDFNSFFTVYAPGDYGRDMLYWLTPELMEILKTHFAQYDIELVDNYVYLYAQQDFQLNQTGITNLLATAAWLHNEFEDNTKRYRDDRVGSFAANIVAEPGRRLKQKFPWWIIVGILIWILVQFLDAIR